MIEPTVGISHIEAVLCAAVVALFTIQRVDFYRISKRLDECTEREANRLNKLLDKNGRR